jgi:CRP-like cAMP-binding protein
MKVSQILQKNSLFKFLSDDQLKDVIEIGKEETYRPGEVIFRGGQEVGAIYLLLHGCVSLTIDVPEEIDLMADTLQETGSIFGTDALAGSRGYSVTAKCIRGATVQAFDSVRVQEIVRREPAVGLEVMAELARLSIGQLNTGRRAITGLFRIFKSQAYKPQIQNYYGEFADQMEKANSTPADNLQGQYWKVSTSKRRW